MTSPHDRPTARELLEAVAEWMGRDLPQHLDPRTAFHARVARNILEMVSREIDTAVESSRAQEAAWTALGVRSNEQLSDLIRKGVFDSDLAGLIGVLRPVIRHKVWVADPKWLED